jgi:hypothetical protein
MAEPLPTPPETSNPFTRGVAVVRKLLQVGLEQMDAGDLDMASYNLGEAARVADALALLSRCKI